MKENDFLMEENKFMSNLLDFLINAIESGDEVHIVDRSEDGEVVEHVYTNEPDEVPFDDDMIRECDEADCNMCPYECGYDNDASEECDVPLWGIPDIDRIVFNDPATIVFWQDGTKTVVKCMNGEKFERYAGFIAACAKKMFGSTSRAKAVMNWFAVEEKPKKEKAEKAEETVKEYEQIAMDEIIKEAVHEALER